MCDYWANNADHIVRSGHSVGKTDMRRIWFEWMVSNMIGMKWTDLPQFLTDIRPEDTKYVTHENLIAALNAIENDLL